MDVTSFDMISLETVKNVFIDLDNTLYPYEPSHQYAIDKCYVKFCQFKKIDRKKFEALYREARNEVTTRLSPQGACRSRLLAFLSIFERMETSQSYELAADFDNLYWDSFISHMKISEPASHFLKRSKDLSIPVCIVSDMITNIQVRKIKALKIEPYIDRLVTSEECGAEKPHAVMFETALKKMMAKPETSIFIGDDYKKDFLGSQARGMKPYLVEAV